MPDSPSQAEFAVPLGFSRNTVARYERDEPGANKPIVIMQWARVTGYDYHWLLGDEEGGQSDESVDKGRDTRRYPPIPALDLVA